MHEWSAASSINDVVGNNQLQTVQQQYSDEVDLWTKMQNRVRSVSWVWIPAKFITTSNPAAAHRLFSSAIISSFGHSPPEYCSLREQCTSCNPGAVHTRCTRCQNYLHILCLRHNSHLGPLVPHPMNIPWNLLGK